MLRVFGVLAIVILAGCAAAPVASDAPTDGGSPAGTPSARPTIPSVPTPTPTPTPSPPPATDPPTPSHGSIRFVEVARFDDLELYDVAAFDGGYVAGGCRLEITDERVRCGAPLLLHSADGRRWDPVEVPGSGGTSILAVVATPIGLLALGTDHAPEPPGTRFTWRSEDGVAWQPFDMPAPPSIVFETAAVLGQRTILIGSDTAYDFALQTEAWWTDGRTWSNGSTPMTTKVEADPGLVAIGEDCADVCPDDIPLSVYRSADGMRWAEDPRDPSLSGGTVGALGSFGGRAVVAGTLGNESDATSVVWIDEPQGWRAVPLDGGDGGVPRAMLEVDDHLVVVAQSEDGGPDRAWSTADGRTWNRVPIEGIDGGYVVASATGGSTAIVVDYQSIRISER